MLISIFSPLFYNIMVLSFIKNPSLTLLLPNEVKQTSQTFPWQLGKLDLVLTKVVLVCT